MSNRYFMVRIFNRNGYKTIARFLMALPADDCGGEYRRAIEMIRRIDKDNGYGAEAPMLDCDGNSIAVHYIEPGDALAMDDNRGWMVQV